MTDADHCRDDEPTEIGEHEHELATRLPTEAPEYELAHWATSNLATALHAAGQLQPPAEEPEHSIRRALLVSSARVFRLARAGMAVLAAGYEAEARGLDRSLWETRAFQKRALADESGAFARKLLAGRLEGGLSAAVVESLPTIDPDQVRSLYRALSGDVHPDLRQFMSNLLREKPTGGYEMSFSPGRTPGARRSLFLYAWFAGETTIEVGLRTGVDLPHHAELELALFAAAERMRRDFTLPDA
jgi:hypothetical protein